MKFKKLISSYELEHIIWKDIEYDRDKLIKFLNRRKWVNFLCFFSTRWSGEYITLNKIFLKHDFKKLKGLLNNDPEITRMAVIEKYAKRGAIDILTTGVFHRETYEIISNLPISDFKLIIKRTQELIEMGRSITSQKTKISDNLPGL
jgi:hypothetical protein